MHTGQALSFRVLAEGATPIPLEDEKSVRARIDQVKQRQTARPSYKPPPDHPWKRAYPDRLA